MELMKRKISGQPHQNSDQITVSNVSNEHLPRIQEVISKPENDNNNTIFHIYKNGDSSAPHEGQPMIGMNLSQQQSVEIDFQNIKYTVRKYGFKKPYIEDKEIIHGINGTFRPGQLSAIMGPSGAGKTTLLNILAGYTESGVSGNILVNNIRRPSNSQTFRKLTAYIFQDDNLRAYLTVDELMTIATHLKLGYKVTKAYKEQVKRRILTVLGLEKWLNVYSGKLSGGQRRRLAIALELINNPPIIFLDEPTTGLDSSSCTRCISMLKRLAQDGRTIICTIHQPSALIFEMIDHLYSISQGHCIYQGPTNKLVTYLSSHQLECPNTYNPADFLMDIAVGEYDADIMQLKESADKQYNRYYRRTVVIDGAQDGIIDDGTNKRGNFFKRICQPVLKYIKDSKISNETNTHTRDTEVLAAKFQRHVGISPATLFRQYLLLFERNFKSTIRNKFLINARILCHVIIGILFGYLYMNVGPNSSTILANYSYMFGTMLLIVYTGKMSVVMSFPLEIEILKREHFNHWYNLVPFYLSVISFEIPFQIFCATLYTTISYYLTGNYYEWYRFMYFIGICAFGSLCAQSWGFLIGSTLPLQLAVFVGPILAVIFSVYGFCNRYEDITPVLGWVFHVSYYRAGFHGLLESVYGYNRSYLLCEEHTLYCHFRDPRLVLKLMYIDSFDMGDNMLLMAIVFMLMHTCTVIFLWYKMNKR